VQAQVTDTSDGLKWFQRKPPGMKGQTFLDHMFGQRQISFKVQEKEQYFLNYYLNLAMKPCNVKILKHMTSPDLSKRSVMQDCAVKRATLNLATRKLNQTGHVQHQCGLVNMEDKVPKLNNALQLSQSMATISNEQSNESAQKKIELQVVYGALAPSALAKLVAKNGNPTKITKKEILSISFSVFRILEEEKHLKDILVEILMKHIDKDPTKIPLEVVRQVFIVVLLFLRRFLSLPIHRQFPFPTRSRLLPLPPSLSLERGTVPRLLPLPLPLSFTVERYSTILYCTSLYFLPLSCVLLALALPVSLSTPKQRKIHAYITVYFFISCMRFITYTDGAVECRPV
jgi:hypothetical protein